MECVNLKELSEPYRLFRDEAGQFSPDPWFLTLRGKGCEVYPSGGDLLRADIDGRPLTVTRLIKLGCKLVRDGDRERTVEFPVKLLDKIAPLLMLRRRRVLTEEQKAALVAMGTQFTPRGREPKTDEMTASDA